MSMDTTAKAAQHINYPTKKGVNLAKRQESPLPLKKLVPALVLLLAALVLFAKFGVADPLARLQRIQNEAANLEAQRDILLEANAGYADLAREYAHVSSDWMTPDMRATVPAGRVLDVMETVLLPESRVRSISAARDAVSVQLTGITLTTASRLVTALYALPQVTDVQVNSAQTTEDNRNSSDITVLIRMVNAEEGGEH